MSDSTPNEDIYRYADRAQAALLAMVRDVMREAAENGLAGAHHFYLTYYTQAEGVEMSDRLRATHPQEITIVLQNQFEDLVVNEDGFEVTLSFNNVPERLRVPFAALSKFYDPSVAFGLMFDAEAPDDLDADGALGNEDPLINDILEAGALAAEEEQAAPDGQTGETDKKDKSENQTGEVVSLDSFRDK